ncbi:MAG: DUF1549 and DUF1553 domain-containing protein [Planctomycetes bacterium]|nr:DUF1549 and DUF1553 domain-containing protein [Planctomycetota bacterium]
MPRLLALVVVAGTVGVNPPLAKSAEPLHVRIDAIIDAKAKAENAAVAAPADDAEFLRRAYLDFAGTIPPVSVTRAFLSDTSASKREKLIESLLNSPTYATHMADLFNVALMERLGDSPEWSKYLRESFAKNKPYDQMVREMLRANSKDTNNVGASFWISKRLENYGQNPVDYSALTRDVGRLFLGKNFQCCECHDHLFIDDYKQQHFQGLHTFFKNTFLSKGVVAEKLTTEKHPFASVFTKIQMTTGPSLPGMMMIDIPMFAKGMEFVTPPDRKTNEPGVPKFSTLQAISEQLPTAKNTDFTRNAVNRIWFAVMGRGLVHPLDLHHSRNPASHPELLTLLADEFASHKFDIKWLLGELALTKTYQRSSVVVAGKDTPDARLFAVALEKRLSADQLLNAMLTATENDAKVADTLRPKFVKAFANQAREPEDEIAPSLKGALFVLHDAAVLELVNSKPGNLVERVAKLDDAAATDELYLAVLSRKPTETERAAVAKLLAKHTDKRAEAVGRVAWALLASMEFGVNH